MDREIVYVGQIPLETDLLLTNKNTMLALGALMQAVLGTSVSVDGLACIPNSPAALNVKVGPGSIHSLQNVDGTAYGTIAADTANQIVKQGLAVGTQTLSCPAPVTTGQSINFLIQVAYQDTDAGSTVLPYYNASNPAVAWSGPNNTGVSQNTVRKGVCLIGVKAGIAATTGTQTTPAPDAGYTGLYAVTVANGQTTITSGNIAQLATAPFIAAKLPAMLSTIQSGAANFAQDTSGAANTITVTLNPAPVALTNGMRINVKVANSSSGPTIINANGLGNVAAVTTSGAAFGSNTVVANGIFSFVYDANGNRWQLQGFTAASATGLIPANNLSDVSSASTSLTNLGILPGFVFEYYGLAEPAGFLFCSGLTIGSASSGATARANADTQALFNALWASGTNTTFPIYTSAGSASTRGANAAADWAANKRMTLPDRRGTVGVGRDDMGGTAANRVTTGGSGISGTTLGATGGEQTHTLTTTEMPSHSHSIAGGHNSGGSAVAVDTSALNQSEPVNTASTGGDGPHNNMQPSTVCNFIIKL
ncbi:hypothetical protein [Limnoglobus roseus]|uniref:Phage tail collar domain-containing protein n=1 Tax=Limnoglobus roseus TaxID=2598579 RepID=A0A5C1ACN0_9BACT|nr:hypothetical protein [Limnoglobus roseus]QEL14798.1 hypothetical protein PX52LOC_01692 [Limnoglobus roseus]